ncbi:acyltransferase family protein [Cellulomonas humilata]|uniref:Peptidoglycan/LPS O-acetylase OafA/YrhL n=1 Tax=Cellulomonas humilata TaxID=144055 RepID=A0ABU0ED80_9CELL|nr:acyltransferase [Cellulomonas humilata]MDQ0373228.1 peptidoglycan/LPS O-acetylase OafA/YrhL [Cellulomonas humilata]
MTASPRPRLAALDALRFGAAAAVVLYHFTARTSSAWGDGQAERLGGAGRWTGYGSLGPELFFVISGFVILMTAWGRPTAHVVASRIGRLYPAYWVAVLSTGLLLLVVWPEGKQVTAHQVLVNLTMLQSALGVDHVDGVYWTLWTELRFYLLLGIFSLVGITRGRVVGVALVWPWVALLAERAGATGLATLLVADYAPLFAAGMALFVLVGDRERAERRLLPWLAVGTNTALAVALVVPSRTAVLERTTGYVPSAPLLALAVVACVAAVAVVVLTRVSRWEHGGLVALGGLTYPLYLVHEYWGLGVIRLLADQVPAAVALAAALVVVTGLAWAVHRYVEVPCGPYLRRETLALLEGARSVVLDRVMRGPRMVQAMS